MRMYCITINNSHYDKIKQINYIPIGLGEKISNKNFKNDKNGENISHKNPYYGEYTFHYWMWKNEINKISEGEWIGFCQYRKFWSLNANKNYKSLNDLKEDLINEIPEAYKDYDSIMASIYINKFKLSKFLKKIQLRCLKIHHYFLIKKKY